MDDSAVPRVAPNQEKSSWWVAPFALVSTVVLFLGAEVVGALILYRYGQAQGWSDKHVQNWLNNSIPAQFIFLIISESLVVLGVYGLMRFLNWNWRTIGLIRPKARHLLLGLGATIPYYVLYIALVAVLTQLIPSLNVNQKQELGFDHVTGTTALVLTFISLVIIPPLVEEIAMRGFLYTGLKKWLPRIAAGLVVSAVFGLFHILEGGSGGGLFWIGAIDTFTLSVVLVALREYTGSLWSGMVLHACKNGIAFVLLYILHTS